MWLFSVLPDASGVRIIAVVGGDLTALSYFVSVRDSILRLVVTLVIFLCSYHRGAPYYHVFWQESVIHCSMSTPTETVITIGTRVRKLNTDPPEYGTVTEDDGEGKIIVKPEKEGVKPWRKQRKANFEIAEGVTEAVKEDEATNGGQANSVAPLPIQEGEPFKKVT